MATIEPPTPGGNRRRAIIKITAKARGSSKARHGARQQHTEPQATRIVRGATVNAADGGATSEEEPRDTHFADDDITPEFAQEADNDNEDPVAAGEVNPDQDAGNDSALMKPEQDLQDNQDQGEDDDFFDEDEEEPKSRFKAIMTSRKVLISGGVGAVITIIIATIISSAPVFILTHLSDVLTGKIGEVSLQHQRQYRRKAPARLKDIFTKDGRRGGALMARMERKKYRFVFEDSTDSNRITGIITPDGVKKTDLDMTDEFESFLNKEKPFFKNRWRSKHMQSLYKRFKIPQRSLVQAGSDDLDSPDATLRKNLAQASDTGELDLTTNKQLSDDTPEPDRTYAERLDELAKNGKAFSELRAYALKGGDLDVHPNQKLVGAWRDAARGAGKDLFDVADDALKGISVGKAFNALKDFGVATSVADTVCIINKRLALTVVSARTFMRIAEMRMVASYITASDGVKANLANSGLVGALLGNITSKDSNGQYFGASPGIQAALYGSFNKTTNDTVKSGFSLSGTLGEPWNFIKNTTKIPGCDLWQNPFFQLGLFGVEVAATILTGGLFKAGEQTLSTAARKAVKEGFERLMTRRFVANMIGNVALDVTFEKVMALVQIYAERTMSAAILGQESGALLGSILVGGAGSFALSKGMRAGQVPATAKQYGVAYRAYLAERREERKNQSVFARYFDLNNTDSFAFTATTTLALNNMSAGQMLGNLSNGAVAAPANLARSFMRIGSGTAFAQDGELVAYDTQVTEGDNRPGLEMATDTAGNLLTITREDITNLDEQTTIDNLLREGLITEPQYDESGEIISAGEPLGAYKTHMENCVETPDLWSRIEAVAESDLTIETDCLAEKDETKEVKKHLEITSTLEEFDTHLFAETSSSGDLPSTNTGDSAKYIPDCNAGNAKIACVAIDELLGIPYSIPNRAAPTTPDPVPFLDCSAFTGMAVYRAYGTDLKGIASVGYRNNPNFEMLADIRSIQPGDLVGRGTVATGAGGNGHIGVVVKYDPSTGELVTAETNTSKEVSRILTNRKLKVDAPSGGTYEWAVRYIGPKGGP